jgi:hypothetical protein
MVKKLFFILVACLLSIGGYAQGTQIHFQVNEGGGVLNPIGGTTPFPRTPIQSPDISIDSHTLYFWDVDYNVTLALLDEDDIVVYTTVVPAYTASINLPVNLIGNYQILIIPSTNYYFSGWIVMEDED